MIGPESRTDTERIIEDIHIIHLINVVDFHLSLDDNVDLIRFVILLVDPFIVLADQGLEIPDQELQLLWIEILKEKTLFDSSVKQMISHIIEYLLRQSLEYSLEVFIKLVLGIVLEYLLLEDVSPIMRNVILFSYVMDHVNEVLLLLRTDKHFIYVLSYATDQQGEDDLAHDLDHCAI